MKLKEICKILGYEYDNSHGNRILENIRKEYIIEQTSPIHKDYVIVRPLTDREKIMLDNSVLGKGKLRTLLARSGIRFEEADKKGCIYCIKLDNKVYVGQTNNLTNRLQDHISNKIWKSTYNNKQYEHTSVTYDVINNEKSIVRILEYCDEQILRLEKEREWTEYYVKLGFNVINDETVLYKKDKQKPKTKTIKVSVDNYDLAVELLRKNNLI